MHAERTTGKQYHGVTALALLAVTAIPAVSTAQEGWTDEQLDGLVFRRDGNAAAARARLNAELSARVAEIDRDCRLTDSQKKKLELAGRGDIQRFFDRCDQAKEKFRLAKNDEPKPFVVLQPRVVGPDEQKVRLVLERQGVRPLERQAMVFILDGKVFQDLAPVQQGQAGLFHEDSLFYKSLRRTLTDEQFARFEAMEAERRERRGTIEKDGKLPPPRPAVQKK